MNANDLLAFLGTIRNVAWVYLWVMFAVALGLFFLDRKAKARAAEEAETLPERKAA